MKNLSEKALLVNIRISQWGAKKNDENVSKEIERSHNAHDAGRFNKNLINDEELSPIKKIVTATRKLLFTNTLPWGDNGDRLLPATNFFEFRHEFEKNKDQFDTCVDKFIEIYPSLKEDARTWLNGMFKEQDYPSPIEMKLKFGMNITFMPISDLKDFRLNVDRSEIENIKANIESEIFQRITDATKNICERIQEAVRHMLNRLSDKDAVFRDSMVNNISELIETLPRLNFTDNPDINNILEDLKTLVVSPERLRQDSVLRNRQAIEAEKILSKVSDFLKI